MDFSRLSDIIEFAAAKEQEAADFYNDLAERVRTETVEQELRRLARMEEGHRDWLRGNGVAIAATGPASPVVDLKISDFTVEPEPSANMTWHDIVNLAMHREAAAAKLYNSLSRLVTDPQARQAFQNLASEEDKHKLYFETIWDNEVMLEN